MSPNAPVTTDPLLRFRAEFPTLDTSTYLISNSLGAMPRGAAKGLEAYAKIWTERGVRAWAEEWWGLARIVGNEIGSIFNAPENTVSMHQNVTLAQAIVVSCFDWTGKRNKVVYSDMNFPSLQYMYEGYARSLGAEIDVVKSEDGIHVSTEAMLEAIDENTLLVPISHVLFRSSYIQDAEAICKRAKEVGAHVLLDAFQAIGTVPVDVQALDCAFLVGGVLKWLSGGPGGVFLYVRPDLIPELKPKLTGWMAHPNPFDFAAPPMQFADDAYRFQNGTPNVPALYAAREGPRLVREAGMDNIRAKSMRQTARIREAALAEGWTVNAPENPAQRGGTIAVDVPHAAEVKLEMLRRDVVVDYRPGAGIRISPHYYNTDDECDRAIAEIKDILTTGAWKAHEGEKPTVT